MKRQATSRGTFGWTKSLIANASVRRDGGRAHPSFLDDFGPAPEANPRSLVVALEHPLCRRDQKAGFICIQLARCAPSWGTGSSPPNR